MGTHLCMIPPRLMHSVIGTIPMPMWFRSNKALCANAEVLLSKLSTRMAAAPSWHMDAESESAACTAPWPNKMGAPDGVPILLGQGTYGRAVTTIFPPFLLGNRGKAGAVPRPSFAAYFIRAGSYSMELHGSGTGV